MAMIGAQVCAQVRVISVASAFLVMARAFLVAVVPILEWIYVRMMGLPISEDRVTIHCSYWLGSPLYHRGAAQCPSRRLL